MIKEKYTECMWQYIPNVENKKLLKVFFFEHIMWFIYLVTEIIPSEHLITPPAVSATEVQ